MNQTFSLTRFGRLLRTYFTDNRGQLLANLALLIGGLIVLSAFAYQASPRAVEDQRSVLFFIIGWSGLYVFTVQQTVILNQKERAINYLMRPASQFEKIILIGLISALGFVVVYTFLFYVVDALGVSFVNHRNWTPRQLAVIRLQGSSLRISPFFDEKNMGNIGKRFWVFSALLHPFTIAFSLLVRRYTLPLVVVIAFAFLVSGYFANNFLLHILTSSDTIRSVVPFSDASVESPVSQYQYRLINLPQPTGDLLRYGIGIVAVGLLYVTAYYRLKEREV